MRNELFTGVVDNMGLKGDLFLLIFYCIINTEEEIQKWTNQRNWHTGQWQTNPIQNTIYVGRYYAQTITHSVNKTWARLQISLGKDEPNIVVMQNVKTYNRTTQTMKNEQHRPTNTARNELMYSSRKLSSACFL